MTEPDSEPGLSSNLQLARDGMSAWSRGDLDAALAAMHPEVEWHLALRLPDLPPGKDVFHGHDEVRALWSRLRDAWDEITLTIEEVPWEGDSDLVLRVRFHGTGGGSGIEVDRQIFYAMRIEDGQLRLVQPFEEEADARAAAGAPPE